MGPKLYSSDLLKLYLTFLDGTEWEGREGEGWEREVKLVCFPFKSFQYLKDLQNFYIVFS